MRAFYFLVLISLIISSLYLHHQHSQPMVPGSVQSPSQWDIPGKKIVQQLEEDITKDLRERITPNAQFSDFYAEPRLKVIPMGRDKQQILVVTLQAFKTQDGAGISVYRLDGDKPQLIQEFDCWVKEACEILSVQGENALLIHDEEKGDGNGCLYLLQDEKLKKVFEYPDSDHQYQNGSSFQTRLKVENQVLFLYRWDSPNGKRVDDDLAGTAPCRKAKIFWNEKADRFEQGPFEPVNS